MDNLIHADCLDAMAAMDADSIDAIVTDPPYGLEFMGKKWDRLGDVGQMTHSGIPDRDGSTVFGRTRVSYSGSANRKCRACNSWEWDYPERKCSCEKPDFPNVKALESRRMQDWHEAWAREAFRIAKPGAHLLAFGGTRTVHRLAAAIEDAGWEIRDMLVWGYASGFPKSLDVSKAIDRMDAATVREQRNYSFTAWMRSTGITARQIDEATGTNMGGHYLTNKSQPAVATADLFDRLRPLLPEVPANIEALVYERTVESENFKARAIIGERVTGIATGNGAVAYIGDSANRDVTAPATPDAEKWNGWGTALKPAWEPIVMARKPLRGTVAANVLRHGTGALNIAATRIEADDEADRWPPNVLLSDPIFPNGYSRYFLIPKSARAEREPVLGGHGLPTRRVAQYNAMGDEPPDGIDGLSASFTTKTERANVHPTVKPLDLMRHLVRLVTPPGGVVLDPFLGSGTTALAAEMEGFAWIGIEKEAEYIAITEARLNGTQRGLGLEVGAPIPKMPNTHPDLSKHQPKRRAPGDNYSGHWAGTEDDEAV